MKTPTQAKKAGTPAPTPKPPRRHTPAWALHVLDAAFKRAASKPFCEAVPDMLGLYEMIRHHPGLRREAAALKGDCGR